MSRLALDLKIAFRSVVRARFVSTLAVLAFALGIGVTTAVFSIFNGVLLAPLPYADGDRLVLIYDTQPACPTCPASYPKYIDWRERNTVFAAVGGASGGSVVLTGAGDPVRMRAATVTASLGDVLGVRPQLGRWFTNEEDRPGGPKVTVLSHGVWLRQFGGEPAIVGRTVRLDGEPTEVIGVMPASFTPRGADVFLPLQRKLDPATRGNHFLTTYAKLKPGVTVERAAAEMRTLGQALAREFGTNHGIDVQSLLEATVGDVRTPLRVLLGAVLCVLLIACTNVANLLLAAGLARRRELAIRLALGAGIRDLARQMTLESVILSVTGGAIGIVAASWMLRTFVALAGTQLPRAAAIAIDARVLAFSAIVTIATGILCGLWPLARLRMSELASAVRETDLRTGSGSGRRFGSVLVVAEMAMAFALLAGAGLLVKNLVLLRSRDSGIQPERIVAFDLVLSGPRYKDGDQQVAFFKSLDERLSHAAGVDRIGMVSHLPMYSWGMNSDFQVEGPAPWGPNDAPLVEYRFIHGDYLQTMGIRLVQGRLLDVRDRRGATTVLINEAMARRFWPGADPVGKRLGNGADRTKWWQVVGVLSDVRSFGLTEKIPYEFYQTIEESPFSTLTVVVRTRNDDPMTIVPTARQIVAELDPLLPISRIQTMEHVVSESVGQPRLMSALTTLFGVLAGGLASVGVYGVMAYTVRRQRREFGIRLALGADAARVRNLVVLRGLTLTIAGIVIGMLGAWLLTGVLKTMLNDVKPTDPTIFAATAVSILVVATLASYLPARAAARVDPIMVLRDDA